MLQIISGKFFESDERHMNECKGILYSNISLSRKIETCVATLEPADVYGQTSGYVMSYINQIEKEKDPQGFSIIKTGDSEIQRQFKFICTFGLRALFDDDRNVVYRMCRSSAISSHEQGLPSQYVNRILDNGLHATQSEIDQFVLFVENLIGLPRNVYNIVINCLGAYEAAIKLLDDNFNLAYSMMVYCAETLAQNFDKYVSTWDDCEQNKRIALEKCFKNIPSETSELIKQILVRDNHLKLTKRFVNFAVKYLDDTFFIEDSYTIQRAIKRDEVERSLMNAYNARSRFVHSLEPILRNLTHGKLIKNTDIYRFMNDSYLTFNGLARIVHRIIWNFVFSHPKVSSEKINWRYELPGVIKAEIAPQYWVWIADNFTPKQITKKLEGLFELLIQEKKEIPDMRPLLTKCTELFDTAEPGYKTKMFCLYYLYNSFIREEFRSEGYNEFIKKNEHLLLECTIENMAVNIFPLDCERSIEWKIEECEEVIYNYKRKKFNGKSIRLPDLIETLIYLTMANSYKNNNEEKQKEWLKQALLNCSGNKALQDKIIEHLETLKRIDIIQIFDHLYGTKRDDDHKD